MIDHHREFENELRDIAGRHHAWRVFSDFCEMAAISIANSAAVGRAREKREAQYMKIVSAYDAKEVQGFPRMLGITVDALEAGEEDFLGQAFMKLELFNHWKGQYFTPYSLSKAIARMTIDDKVKGIVDERGFVRVHEPACGSGAMLIAFADALRDQGINPQQQMHATAWDVDSTAAHMAYIQLSLSGIPATVVTGNTLSLEVREVWHTPFHILGMWDQKIERGYAIGSRAALGEHIEAPAPVVMPSQGDLFEVAA